LTASKPSREAWLFAAALLAAALSSPRDYEVDRDRIVHGVDFKYDFVAATWVARGKPLSQLDRDTADAIGVSLGTDPGPVWKGTPAHTHPPPATAIVRPLLGLGYKAATLVFFALSLALVVVQAQMLLGLWRRAERLPTPRQALPLAVALSLWPPSLFNFGYGQWSILGATLLTAGWWNLERRRPRWSAGWFAAAIAIKSTPALLGGYLIFHARRVALLVLAGFAAIALVTLPFVGGFDAWRTYVRSGPVAVTAFETFLDNTASVRGIFVRLFVTNPFTIAPVHRPALAHALSTATTIALIATAIGLTIRRGRVAPRAAADSPAFAMWVCLLPLVNPLAWTHNVIVLLLPAVLLARDGASPARRRMVAVAMVLLTIPRGTLVRWAGFYVPFDPARGWILGVHALACLLLFFSACAAAVSEAPPAPAPDRS
jgi:hypothetical protein